MPIYRYQCTACSYTFEELQKITENPLVVCPQCNKDALTKLISSPNFHLKGTGWYVTDFKDKNKKAAESTVANEQPTTAQQRSAHQESVDAKSQETSKQHGDNVNSSASQEQTKATPTTNLDKKAATKQE